MNNVLFVESCQLEREMLRNNCKEVSIREQFCGDNLKIYWLSLPVEAKEGSEGVGLLTKVGVEHRLHIKCRFLDKYTTAIVPLYILKKVAKSAVAKLAAINTFMSSKEIFEGLKGK